MEHHGGPLELRDSVAVVVRSWLLLCVLQLISLRLLEAGFTLARARVISCACVWDNHSTGSDLKGPATAASTWRSVRSALPLTGHGRGAVVRPHNYSGGFHIMRLYHLAVELYITISKKWFKI